MLKNTYAVIMAGGKGERFWPLSTSKKPKQILTLFGGKPMLRMALDYVKGLIPPERVFVITSADLKAAICRIAPELPRDNVIGEPFGRDTAAVCALATALVKAKDPEGVICTLTADHIIKDVPLFQQTISDGVAIAKSGDWLVIIGIQPTFPSTGFGYIEAAKPFRHKGGISFYHAKRFVEKPDLDTATSYLKTGRYCWNAGMFIWTVTSFQKALCKFRPQLFEMAERLTPCVGKSSFTARLKAEYVKLDRISVDYAVMEKSHNIIMAKGAFSWDDVGSWLALANHFNADLNGNVVIGDVASVDAGGNIVVSHERLTALLGVKDLVVVQAGKATLVCSKDRAQDVKKLVQLMAAHDRHKRLL